MATFLELGLLRHFIVIFPFLLVFVGTYAILTKLKILGDDKGINAIIAFSIAAIFLFIQDAALLLIVLTPWFTLSLFILFFILLMFQFLGVQKETISAVMDKQWTSPHWIIVFIVAGIVLVGMGQVYGPRLAELDDSGTPSIGGPDNEPGTPPEPGEDGEFSGRVKDILFHPQVVGMILLLLIITFAIRTLAVEEKED